MSWKFIWLKRLDNICYHDYYIMIYLDFKTSYKLFNDAVPIETNV